MDGVYELTINNPSIWIRTSNVKDHKINLFDCTMLNTYEYLIFISLISNDWFINY